MSEDSQFLGSGPRSPGVNTAKSVTASGHGEVSWPASTLVREAGSSPIRFRVHSSAAWDGLAGSDPPSARVKPNSHTCKRVQTLFIYLFFFLNAVFSFRLFQVFFCTFIVASKPWKFELTMLKQQCTDV